MSVWDDKVDDGPPDGDREAERLSVHTQQGMDTAREAPVGYDSGDASVVVGSAVTELMTDLRSILR